MNLLILNSKVDRSDSGLEVASEWIEALASRVARVSVITNEAGDVSVPANVDVSSLGLEHGLSRPRRVARFYRHLRRILLETRPDACFVHMVPQFAVLAGPLLMHRRVPIVQWYTHRSAPWSLRVSHRLVDRVVSASRESFALKSSKLLVTGHGIDTARFHPAQLPGETPPYRVLTAGRLSPSKRIEVLIDAVAELRKEGLDCRLDVVGEGRDDAGRAYARRLVEHAGKLGLGGAVTFQGPVARRDIPRWYQRAHMFVNLSDTDSIDKAVLEAMACAVPVLTSNTAFRPLLSAMPELQLPKGNAPAVAAAIRRLATSPAREREALGLRLRELVRTNHDLDRLADRLVALFDQLAREKARQ